MMKVSAFLLSLPAVAAALLFTLSAPAPAVARGAHISANPGLPAFQSPPEPQGLNLRFERISLEEGLSQSAVLSMGQDQQGFMWLATEGGLNRYDGYQFTVFKHDVENPDSLADDYVSEIFSDRSGALWIGTRSGLDLFHPSTGTFSHYRHDDNNPQSLSGAWVTGIAQAKDGTLWVGTDAGGLDQFNPATQVATHYRHDPNNPKSISFDSVRVLYQDASGDLWVATENGLDRLDHSTGSFIHYRNDPRVPASLSSDLVTTLFEDREGVLWIGTEDGGLNRWDRATQTFTHYRHDPDDSNSLSHDRVKAILQDRAGRLWIGTQNGLDQFDRQQNHFTHYRNDPSDPNSLSSDTIWSLYEDRSGVVWVGTYNGGVNKYSDLNNRFAAFRHNPYLNSLTDNMVWSICKDRNGMVWIGTFNGGLNKLNRENGTFTFYRHKSSDPNSLSNDDVRAIAEDPDGSVWIGTSGGLDRLSPGPDLFEHYRNDPNNPNSLSDNRIDVLLVDRQGNVWVGTRSGGLDRFERATGTFFHYRHDPDDPSSLSDNRVWALYQDRAGAIWVGTLGGINVLDPASGRFTRYINDPKNPQSLSNNSAFSFYQDESGAVWVGTWGSGLDRLDRETQTFTHYTQKNGLPDNTIYGIEADALGFLWLSTNHGLARFDPRTKNFRTYDIRDGLQSNEFNAGAHFRSPDGEMFFGGVNGFNIFYPDRIRDNPYAPPVVITDFSKFNRSVRTNLTPGEHIQLNYNDNFISFDFATLDYTAPRKNQYAYKMEGLDLDWVYAGTRRHADYPNLSPGEYVFRVKGTNNDGLWNEQGLAVYLNIAPPFWETWWFRGVLGLAVLSLAVGAYRWRVQSLQARSRQLEKQVKARTAELAEHTQELEALYRADQELYSQLSMDRVLQALVDVTVDLLHTDKSMIFLWDEEQGHYAVKVARNLSAAAMAQLTFRRGEGTVGQVTETGDPLIIRDIQADVRRENERPEILALADRERVRAFMNIPLQVHAQVFGIFSVAFEKPHLFGTAEQRLYLALAQRAAVAIENAQLYERAQQAAALEERNRLARELHDAVTQTLFSASLIADVLPKIWERNAEEGRSRLQDLRQLSRGALAEMRTLLLELRPASLQEAKLPDLLRQLTEAFTGRTGVPVQLEVTSASAPPVAVKVALYRIAQEALNNIVKHASPTAVTMRLHGVPDGSGAEAFELWVTDDGCGFDSAHVPSDHLGLKIMRERAQAIGAEFQLDSRPGQGTRVFVRWNAPPS